MNSLFRLRRGAAAGLTLVAMALLSACDSAESPTGVNADGLLDLADDPSLLTNTVTPGIVRTCMFIAGGPVAGADATIAASATAGTLGTSPWVLDGAPPECVEVWDDRTLASGATADITVGLQSANGLVLDRIGVWLGDGTFALEGESGGGITDAYVENALSEVTVPGSETAGATIWFKMVVDDTPPGGGEGCTPGFWRQAHHYDSWTGYAPGDGFNATFGSSFFDAGLTLGEAVELNGGGINALARHAVAALLNASSPDVDYDMSTAEVIAAFNDAAGGDRQEQNAQKDEFDLLNNQGCPLS